MAQTDVNIGQHDRECADELTMVLSALTRARKLYADLSTAIEREIDRLQFQERMEEASDETDKKARDQRLADLKATINKNQDVLATVLRMEAKLMHLKPSLAAAGSTIDLEVAREEITRRLDRLAA